MNGDAAKETTVDLEEEARVIAAVQDAWNLGRYEDAGELLRQYLEAHPERADALRGRGTPPPGEAAEPVPRAVPPDPEQECLRCGTMMRYEGTETFHAGRNLAPFFLGDLGEVFVKLRRFHVYACDACGHIEFFKDRVPGSE